MKHLKNFELKKFDYDSFKKLNKDSSFMSNNIKPVDIIQQGFTKYLDDDMLYPAHNTFNDYQQEAFKLAQRMFGFSRKVFFSDNDTIMTFEVNEKDYALNYNDPFLFNYSVGIQNKKEYKIELSFNDKYIKEYRVDEIKYFIELKIKNL